jgi:glycosyltransferase involved in cell wall biosynthesis/SAM-dependent methyltransferase
VAAGGVSLRVLHLITTLKGGGTERLVLSLAREQQRLGCRVEVAALARGGSMAPAFRAAGLPVHELGAGRKVAPLAFLRLRRLLRAGYDVLHTHLDLADLYGPFAAAGLVPVVVSSRHNTDPWRVAPSWKRRPFLVWERAAHRRTAATIAVSRSVRDFLVAGEGLDPARFVVIPNGIDLTPFRDQSSPAVARARLHGILAAAGGSPLAPGAAARPLAGFVGRLAEQKGIDHLLTALALRPDGPSLVLVGDGPWRPALEARAAQDDLRGRVFFTGAREDVPALLPAFDLLVLPSRWEGFGLAAVEGMAAGLPVVAADVDGLREVVAQGVTGRLVPPGDPVALAAALDAITASPAQARQMGEAGRRRAWERFDARRMAAAVVSIYHEHLPPARLAAAPLPDEEERLAEAQIRAMWVGILPPRLLRAAPGTFLATQRREYAAVADHLERYVPLAGRRLLDLGCGLGTLLLEARARGAAVLGLEPDPGSLALSRYRLRRAGAGSDHLLAAVGEALPVESGALDVVTCCSVLEHVRDPLAVLREVARVLRPGGYLYLGVPNALNFQERHYKVLLPPGTPRPLARLWLRLRGRDPAFLDSLHELTPRRTSALLQAAGLEIVDSPVARRLAQLATLHAGVGVPRRPWVRLALHVIRFTRARFLLLALVRRGFLVDGPWVARRPGGEPLACGAPRSAPPGR